MPIFQRGSNGYAMAESLDIIETIDSDATYGPIRRFLPFSQRTDLADWQSKAQSTLSMCQRPRYMLSLLPEFHQRSSKDAFITSHPIPPYDKKTWQETLQLRQRWEIYLNTYNHSLKLFDSINAMLLELESILYCDEYCTEGGLSIDDIDLWSRLRSLTIVKGVKWPTKLLNYMNHLSTKGDVPLYFQIQL